MVYYEIEISNSLTSYKFYNEVLPNLHIFFKSDHIGKRLVFNLTNCKKIDGLVIPNLLLVGFIIKEYTGEKPVFYIEDILESGKIKSYLHNIGFILLSKKLQIYEFDYSIDCGLSERNMDVLNSTLYFSQDESQEDTWYKINREMEGFATKYLYLYDNKYSLAKNDNLMVDLCHEIIENAKSHGKSFSFLTFQYNFKEEKVKISISDSGVGFLNTVTKGIESGRIGYKIKDFTIKDEIEAIIQGVFSRKSSRIYGLYSTIKMTIEKGGIVRIHSMDSQVVFTNRLLEYFNNSDLNVNKLMSDKNFDFNIRREKKYAGVHIEYEIPLQKAEIKYAKDGGRR